MTDINPKVIRDIAVIRRLSRIVSAGGVLSEKAMQALAQLRDKYPDFEPEVGDRDDFNVYFGGGFRGPRGDPDRLKDVSDDKLLETALSIESEEKWQQADLWSIVCRSEPTRALAAMELAANAGNWPAAAWRTFLESVADAKDKQVSDKVLALLVVAPDPIFVECVYAVGSWMYRQHSQFEEGGALAVGYLALWDRFGDIVYSTQPLDVLERESTNDLASEALNAPGGELALVLLETMFSRKLQQDSGLPEDLKARATKAASGAAKSNLLARVVFIQRLAFIDSVDTEWAHAHLVPSLMVDSQYWREMWQARAYDGHPGLSRLFNVLKPAMLAILARPDLDHNEGQTIAAQLLRAYIWQSNDTKLGYNITANEVRAALASASEGTRQSVSWIFMNWLRGNDEGGNISADQKWKEGIGKTFRDVWPKDANLRDEHSSQQLLWMALSCDACFPEAASFVENLIVPIDVYSIDITFDFDRGVRKLLAKHPKPFLRLLNAAVNPHGRIIPEDLGEVLIELEKADPTIVNEDGFSRLSGAWKLRQSVR